MKTTRTQTELILFIRVGESYLKKHEEKENKLCKKILSFRKQLEKIQTDLNDRMEDTRVDHAMEDEKGALVKDEKGVYRYSKAGDKACRKALRELLNEPVEIHTRIVEDFDVSTLTELEREVFSGLVIPEQPKEEE